MSNTLEIYSPSEVKRIFETWILIANTCKTNTKQLEQHADALEEFYLMLTEVGDLTLSKALIFRFGSQEAIETGSDDVEFLPEDFKQMQKIATEMGVPSKYTEEFCLMFLESKTGGMISKALKEI